MSSFSLHIATDNAAFGEDPSNELARILRATADLLNNRGGLDPTDHRHGANVATVRDVNGNTCGRWFWTDRYATHDDGAALDLIENEITSNENFAPKAMTELLERIADRMRLTGRDNADTFPDYDEEPQRGDYGPDEIDAQHTRDAGRGHLIP